MKTAISMFILLSSTLILAQSPTAEKTYTKEIESSATAGEAWNLITDVSKWKQWDTHVIDAKLDGDFAEKAQGQLVTNNAKIVDFAIIQLNEGETFTVRHKLSSGTLYLKRSVAATNSGNKITSQVWCTGLSGKNFKKYMGGDYAAILEKELLSVKQLLEAK